MVLFGGILSSNAQTRTSEEVKSLIKKKREFNKKHGYGKMDITRTEVYEGQFKNGRMDGRMIIILENSILSLLLIKNSHFYRTADKITFSLAKIFVSYNIAPTIKNNRIRFCILLKSGG